MKAAPSQSPRPSENKQQTRNRRLDDIAHIRHNSNDMMIYLSFSTTLLDATKYQGTQATPSRKQLNMKHLPRIVETPLVPGYVSAVLS